MMLAILILSHLGALGIGARHGANAVARQFCDKCKAHCLD